MNDRTSVNEQIAMASTDKSVAISTVGYMCIAISWWMTGMLLAGWFKPVANIGIDTSTLYGVGSVLLVIMGILSLAYGRRVLDAIVFLATAGLFFSLHNGSGGFFTGGVPSAYIGWWGLVWAVFFCYLWIASFRTGDTTRMLFLLLFWLGALALAISGWTGNDGFYILGGYLLLVTAILAFIVSAAAVLTYHPDTIFRKNVKSGSTPA
ncbi:MAG TPA: hypothetical protein VFX43_14835 [Chitinophagaceae bacterium]|nr:hypothetical protein [Chitinophagaceae bacterium]